MSRMFWILWGAFWFIWSIGWATHDFLTGYWLVGIIMVALAIFNLGIVWFWLNQRNRPRPNLGPTMLDRLAAINDGTASDEDIQIAATFVYDLLEYPTVSRADIVTDMTKRRDQRRGTHA